MKRQSGLTVVHEPRFSGIDWTVDVLIRGGHQPVLGAGSRSWTPRHGGVPLETQAHLALVGLLRALPAADVAQAINSVMGFPALLLDAGTTHGGRWRGAVGLELKRPGYPEGPLLEQVRRQMADRDQHAPNASLLWLGGQDPPSALLDLADQRFRATSLADLTDVLVSVGNVDGETRELARRAVRLLGIPIGTDVPSSRGASRRRHVDILARHHRLASPVPLFGGRRLVSSSNGLADLDIWVNRRAAVDHLRGSVPLLEGRERLHVIADVLAGAHIAGLLRRPPPPPAGPPTLLTGVRLPDGRDLWLLTERTVRELCRRAGMATSAGRVPVEVWTERPASRQRVFAAGEVVGHVEDKLTRDELLDVLAPAAPA